MGINRSLKEQNHDNLVRPVDPEKFINQIVCSVKEITCCNDQGEKCSRENVIIEDVSKALNGINEVNYSKWIRRNKQHVEEEFSNSGNDGVAMLHGICNKTLKIHMYNNRQYSELKYLKTNIKESSADIGKLDNDSGLRVLLVVIVSNQILYERNIAFACNNKVIETVKEFMPSLERVYIWSDGCASQFQSRYVFRSLLYYPDKLKITWDYGEAHHFEGPHDGIGGTVQRKVYQNVSTWQVVKDALYFTTYANEICNVQVEYLDKGDIPSDSKYMVPFKFIMSTALVIVCSITIQTIQSLQKY